MCTLAKNNVQQTHKSNKRQQAGESCKIPVIYRQEKPRLPKKDMMRRYNQKIGRQVNRLKKQPVMHSERKIEEAEEALSLG